jgi:hypothetical protein
VIDPSGYVRDIEAYLCRRNKGHLIRVVGPAFELVRGWASSGVPLKVAYRGIDRCCDRHESRKGRRRPVRIEFCEGDVLDAFDEWRRAVGVASAAGEGRASGVAASRKPALAAHVERAIARLAYARGVDLPSSALHRHIDVTIRELEEIAASAARARGHARAGIIARLHQLDDDLIRTAAAHLDDARAAQLQREAAEELAPFGARIPQEARQRAVHAAFVRLVREELRLPILPYE